MYEHQRILDRTLNGQLEGCEEEQFAEFDKTCMKLESHTAPLNEFSLPGKIKAITFICETERARVRLWL